MVKTPRKRNPARKSRKNHGGFSERLAMGIQLAVGRGCAAAKEQLLIGVGSRSAIDWSFT